MTSQPGSGDSTEIAWVRVSLRERKVVDVDGSVVTLEFTLDIPEDKAWYQCFVQAAGPERTGSALFVDTNPQFSSAETLTWKIELDDIPQAAHYLAERVFEANRYFVELLERQEQIRRQLEEAARRRRDAISAAQQLLDESWPSADLRPLHPAYVAPVATAQTDEGPPSPEPLAEAKAGPGQGVAAPAD